MLWWRGKKLSALYWARQQSVRECLNFLTVNIATLDKKWSSSSTSSYGPKFLLTMDETGFDVVIVN